MHFKGDEHRELSRRPPRFQVVLPKQTEVVASYRMARVPDYRPRVDPILWLWFARSSMAGRRIDIAF